MNMIINATTGRALVKNGKAHLEGTTKPDDHGRRYAIITRYDPQQTDHYPLRDGEDL
jgi:hypothetical protein